MNDRDQITYDTLRENLAESVRLGKDAKFVHPDYEIQFHLKGEQVEVDGFLSSIEIQALSDHMKDMREAKDSS